MASPLQTLEFEALKLKLASPEVIREWSHGEVTKPETINYRTQRPEKDGLFCERIFGPTKDWECYCGKYKKVKYKGIVCDKCGVEVTRSIVRRERMGHIELAVPVAHIWFLRSVPSKIGMVLDLAPQSLERVIYYGGFIVSEVDDMAKAELLEQLKKEYRASKKQIEQDYQQQVQNLHTQGLSKTDLENALGQAESQYFLEIRELDEDYKATEKEIADIVPMQVLNEIDYQALSLKFGHIFKAGIGAEVIHRLLSNINLEEKIAELNEELESAGGAKQKKLIKRVKLLKALHRNNIRPESMILTVLPVIPPDIRPMVPLDGGRFATADLNDLYRRVINRNNRLRKLLNLSAPEVIVRNEKRMLQEAVDALLDNSARRTKTTVASTGQKRALKSLADILKGKQGRFRQNLLGKRVDYSGLSVIVVGPHLRLYQCGVPKGMALELFRPFIISKLIQREMVYNIRSANRFIESNRSEVWDILDEIIADAYVLLNRAPTLHRLGIQAFQPVLVEGKAVQLHPLVCSAFNADFDGDQMAVHVPLTEEARIEARELMLATKNLLKPATGAPISSPSMDISWGVFYMTGLEALPEGANKKTYSSVNEAKMAYNLGHLSLREPIMVKMKAKANEEEMVLETSMGRVFFNEIMPEELPYYNELVDKKKISAIVSELLDRASFDEVAKLLDRIKYTGFKYATKSGYSWGMDDIPVMKEKYSLIDEAIKEADLVESQYDMGLLTKDEKHSQIVSIWAGVKDRVSKMSQEILDKDGSVYSMIISGSRGSWGQLAQMAGMKGLVSNPSGDIIELPIISNFKEGLTVLEYFISTHGTRKGLSDTALRTASAGYLTRRLVDVSQDIIILDDDCHDDEGFVITKEDSETIGTTVVARLQGRWILDDIKDPQTGKLLVKGDTFMTKELVQSLKDVDLESARIRSVMTCKLRRGVCSKCYGSDLTKHQPVELGTAVGIMAAQSIGEPGTQLTMRTFHSGGVAGSDITQGLPRVEELFEVRSPKHKAFLAEAEGVARVISSDEMVKTTKSNAKLLGSNYKQKVVQIAYNAEDRDTYMLPSGGEILVNKGEVVKKGTPLYKDSAGKTVKSRSAGEVITLSKAKMEILTKVDSVLEYIIPPNYVLWIKDGQKVEKGQQLTDGVLDLQQLYLLSGREAVQNYLISEVQNIYASQGQKLNDKHLEIVIRQLFSRVLVIDAGDTDLLPGEIAEKAEVVYQNGLVSKDGGREATYQELLLGISKVSLSSSSFLAAASFQETSKVLINAALTGKVDRLEGLKENIIIGRLIPAGTGFQRKGEGFVDLVEKYGPAPLGKDDEQWRLEHAAQAEEAGLDAKATD